MIAYSRRLAVDKWKKWQDISNWQQAYVTEFINPIRSSHRPKYGATASFVRKFINFVVPGHRNIRSTLESLKFVIILKHVTRTRQWQFSNQNISTQLSRGNVTRSEKDIPVYVNYIVLNTVSILNLKPVNDISVPPTSEVSTIVVLLTIWRLTTTLVVVPHG